MIILRNIFERLFALSQSEEDDQLVYASESFIRSLFKCLLMGNSPLVSNWVLRHWAGHASSSSKKYAGDKLSLKLFLGLVDNYDGLPRRHSKSFAIRMRGGKPTGLDFAKYIVDQIKKESNSDGVKYTDAMKSASFLEEDLIQICKYMALCLTGQLNMNNTEWYDGEVCTMQVNWEKPVEITLEKLKALLGHIIGREIL